MYGNIVQKDMNKFKDYTTYYKSITNNNTCNRSQMTHTGVLKFGSSVYQPTGKEVVNTPQVLSFSFDREGRCYKFTGGYSIDKTIGNCGGLGGVLGIIHAVKPGSIPFPEAKPWKASLEGRLLQSMYLK